jgi:RimJ/RimL family protein N-acetyltransferase
LKRIITERLLLREWKVTDYKDLYEYAKSELVGPNAGWQPHKDEEESKEIIQMFINGNDTYAIELKSENKVIGGIGLHDRKPDEALSHLKQKEIGYVLNPDYWGKGYVPEAVKSLLKYGFEKLNLDLIWCGHYDFNYNSKRVNEKCGFTYQFEKKVRLDRLDGREVTSLYYSISKSEYEELVTTK